MSAILRCRCYLLGDSGVGKTAISQVFLNDGVSFPKNYNMTCGVDVIVKSVKIPETSDRVEMYLVDCSGKKLYRSMIQQMLKTSCMTIMVYDVTDEDSFNNLKNWFNLFKSAKSDDSSSTGVVIGNKIDLTQRRAVTPKAGQELAKSYGFQYFECSAANVNGFESPFFYLANEWHRQHHEADTLQMANDQR
ncbi:IFT27 (predicted) [Pycnogonum litorale]